MDTPAPPKASQPDNLGIHFLDYWRVLRTRKEIVLAVMLLVLVVGSIVTFSLPKRFEASTKIKVKEDIVEDAVFGRQLQAQYNPYFLSTEVEIIRSARILGEVVDQCNLRDAYSRLYNLEEGQRLDRAQAVMVLSANLGVDIVRSTSAVQISVRADTPDRAAEIANKVAEIYRKYRLDVKTAELQENFDSLSLEEKNHAKKVAEKEEALQKIRAELGPDALSIGRNSLGDATISQMESQRISLQIDMLSRKTRFEGLEKLSPAERILAAPLIVYDRNVEDIKKQLMDSELSLTLMLETLGERHPEVVKVKVGVEELRGKLDASINGLLLGLKNDYDTAKIKYDALVKELEAVKRIETSETRAKMRILEKAERELAVQQQILDAVQAKIASERITLQRPRSPVEIFELAEVPKTFVFPKIPLFLTLSTVLGLIAGIGTAFFMEYLDTSVKTVDDLEQYLGLSVIGVIPQKVKPLFTEGPDSPHAEPYRVLRTNLLFSNKGVGAGAYAVISAGVGEGKSTTLSNLAYICASMGEKVLIVDSDMRRPVQHTLLGMSNRFGLTNVLMRDVSIEEAIKPTSVPNLHFLPSGRIPRHSVGLMDAQRMRDLIKNLKTRYDYVFFDSPPIMGVSDASILASEVDAVLLVVQYRKYPRQLSARAKRLIENVGGNIVGVVLNNINVLKDDYYYYHSYYTHYSQTANSEPSESSRTDKT